MWAGICALFFVQVVVRRLAQLFQVVYLIENWSTSTCSRCLRDFDDIQRIRAPEPRAAGDRDKVCPRCKRVPRDPNAAVLIGVSAHCLLHHGVYHPYSKDSGAEASRRERFGSALPIASPPRVELGVAQDAAVAAAP